MELTWQANTPQWRSRTRAAKACPACQRRKKRCRHLAPYATAENSTEPAYKIRKPTVNHSDDPSSQDARSDRRHSTVQERDTSTDLTSRSFPDTERFVGDLNPEAFIRERLDEPTNSRLRDRIGLWISSSPTQKGHHHRHQMRSSRRSTGNDSSSVDGSSSSFDLQTIETLLHQRYASAIRSCRRLPVATREALASIYFSKINHIIPLLEREAFVKAQTDSSISIFLERAVCLVAAKDIGATHHLRLIEGGPILSTRQFCTDLYNGLTVAIDSGLEVDRLNRIRILSLMSLHCEGHEGAEAASLHLCQAIHQAQTVGLHLDRPDAMLSEGPLIKLFWALWTLDKMHASIGGRPVLLADRDIGLQKPNPHQLGVFGVWLTLSELLATVISYYRPSAGSISGWEEGFPAFEDIVGDGNHGDWDFSILGILELYYHCVAILSCRNKLTDGHDSTKVSSIRQGLAAVRIHSIVASECAGRLPPLPIVPYAVALSMGVSYRQLRSSKLITHFNRARASLEACCSLLEDISSQWYSAEAMARLGRKALQQLDHERSRPGSTSTGPLAPHSSHKPLMEPTTAPSSDIPRSPPNEEHSHLSAVAAADPDPYFSTHLPPMDDLDTTMNGFTDIDTLFGEFLDLSLPTNFWDPIFAESEPMVDHEL